MAFIWNSVRIGSIENQEAGLELPPGMPGISLVTLVPGTVVVKDIPAGDTIIPG